MPDTLADLRRDLAAAYRIVANEGLLEGDSRYVAESRTGADGAFAIADA